MALAYITCRDRKEAETISMHLLRRKLIACANIFPVKSMFWWKGKIANSNENIIIAKTSKKNFRNLEKEVKKILFYEIPCILRINATANKGYKKWLSKEIIN